MLEPGLHFYDFLLNYHNDYIVMLKNIISHVMQITRYQLLFAYHFNYVDSIFLKSNLLELHDQFPN